VIADPESLRRLARETGRLLGELGVRPDDSRWIGEHAETIASLTRRARGPGLLSHLRRLARSAARRSR
jgi:hypothetical protein